MSKNKKHLFSIISAASAGTLIEWYDFFLFGSLATILSTEFFPSHSPTAALLATLATFAAGLVVRPLGALIFGHIGDKKGRKNTFLYTLSIMGLSTVAIGFIPGYDTIGFFAPLTVLLLRLIQGLALGGEFGGAIIYVAEHADPKERGFWTSWLQSTTGLAFILSLAIILFVKSLMNETNWFSWGWRVPFLASSILLFISIYMRIKLKESPLFLQAQKNYNTSSTPLVESFTQKSNLKMILLAFLGLTVGGGVIGWVGFYAQSFLLHTVKIDYNQSNEIIIIGIFMGIPFFILFGWLSDRISRKGIMICGLIMGLLTFRPCFDQMYSIPVTGKHKEIISTQKLQNSNKPPEILTIQLVDGTQFDVKSENLLAFSSAIGHTYENVKLNQSDKWKIILINFWIEIIFTMVYAPMAAYLVELFPLRIRYTSLSAPYQLGFGIIGGLSPYFATYFVEKALINRADQYYLAGLNYPLTVMCISILIGLLYLPVKIKNVENHTQSVGLSNSLRRWLGLPFMLSALVIAWLGWVSVGIPGIFSGNREDIVFGCIVTLIITPIAAGSLFLFGKFAWQNEYKR